MSFLFILGMIPVLACFILYFNILAFSRLLFWLFAALHRFNPVLCMVVLMVVLAAVVTIYIWRRNGKRKENAANGITEIR